MRTFKGSSVAALAASTAVLGLMGAPSGPGTSTRRRPKPKSEPVVQGPPTRQQLRAQARSIAKARGERKYRAARPWPVAKLPISVSTNV